MDVAGLKGQNIAQPVVQRRGLVRPRGVKLRAVDVGQIQAAQVRAEPDVGRAHIQNILAVGDLRHHVGQIVVVKRRADDLVGLIAVGNSRVNLLAEGLRLLGFLAARALRHLDQLAASLHQEVRGSPIMAEGCNNGFFHRDFRLSGFIREDLAAAITSPISNTAIFRAGCRNCFGLGQLVAKRSNLAGLRRIAARAGTGLNAGFRAGSLGRHGPSGPIVTKGINDNRLTAHLFAANRTVDYGFVAARSSAGCGDFVLLHSLSGNVRVLGEIDVHSEGLAVHGADGVVHGKQNRLDHVHGAAGVAQRAQNAVGLQPVYRHSRIAGQRHNRAADRKLRALGQECLD